MWFQSVKFCDELFIHAINTSREEINGILRALKKPFLFRIYFHLKYQFVFEIICQVFAIQRHVSCSKCGPIQATRGLYYTNCIARFEKLDVYITLINAGNGVSMHLCDTLNLSIQYIVICIILISTNWRMMTHLLTIERKTIKTTLERLPQYRVEGLLEIQVHYGCCN